MRTTMAANNDDLCVIAFQSEAYDSAAHALSQIKGWTVCAVPKEGAPFDAELRDVVVDHENGQYHAVLAVWDEDAGRGGDEIRLLDIYNDLQRIEVL